MSRFISLCSQRYTSGRLTRGLRWLENGCEDESVCGVMEVRLALDIAWAGCIGCGCGHQREALAALSNLSPWDNKSEDQGKCERMKGRALACAAFLMRWGNGTTPLNTLLIINIEIQIGEIRCSSPEARSGITPIQRVELQTQAARIGNPLGSFSLCSFYEDGDGALQDQKKAVEFLQKAYDMGDADALLYLAACFWEGEGVSQDKKKAIELLQKAADMGNAKAMVILALCYEGGNGVPQDKKKAIELLQKAADMVNSHTITQFIQQKKGRRLCDLTKHELETLIQSAESGDVETASILSSLPD